MSDDHYDPHLRLAPVPSDRTISRGRRWFNRVVMPCSHPADAGLGGNGRKSAVYLAPIYDAARRRPRVFQQPVKPDWFHLPERVWRRHSALLVSLHQSRHG